MTRRDVFERLGGFDEQLPLQGGDIDYCLKVGSAGLRVVFTPYAPLVHYETGGVSAQPVAPSHIAHLRARWGDRLDRDPFYNPNLTREYLDYRVAV
jgi:GT2 family glycosyltransferase